MASKAIVLRDVWVRVPPPALNDLPAAEYAYLLGLYLGDGWISQHPRGVFRLRIALDARYQEVIAECCRAARAVFPENRVGTLARPGCIAVSVYSKRLPDLFPQHGPGRKHTRQIALEAWQQAIVIDHPRWFVKGLFDSDGSYFTNPVKSPAGDRYLYERYMFTNVSGDIRELWIWACSLIGVESRQSNAKNISVARRESVAILNEFLGPKR